MPWLSITILLDGPATMSAPIVALLGPENWRRDERLHNLCRGVAHLGNNFRFQGIYLVAKTKTAITIVAPDIHDTGKVR